jgi:two-component system LytT family sensor kinase
MRKRTEILVHLIFWVVYVFQQFITYPGSYVEEYGFWRLILRQGTWSLTYIIPFYINYFVVIPRLLSRYRYFLFGVAELLLILLGFTLMFLQTELMEWCSDFSDTPFWDRVSFLSYYSFNIVFYLILSVGAKFTLDWFKAQELRRELEKERSESELAMLRYQMSPHFLFNTLNNIYSLVRQKSDNAPEALLKLSEIMRYMIKDVASRDKIPLDKEIYYLENFIQLQKLRIENPGIINYEISGKKSDLKISPMILIAFVENIFKHGDLYSENAFVNIKIEIDGRKLHFEAENVVASKNKDSQQGIGIQNVTRRLELLYPDNYNLDINKKNGNYKVILELELNDD